MFFVFFLHRMCGYYSPSEPLTFLSSGNVMLVTMASNDKKNYPGFRATVTQIKRGSKSRDYCLKSHDWSLLELLYYDADTCFFFNRYDMRWPADERKRQLLFSKLPKLLSSSNFMSVVNPGEMSAFNSVIWYVIHRFLLCYVPHGHMSPCRLVFTPLCQSLRSLLVSRWRWRSESSSWVSLGRKTVKTVAKTTWRSTERSESMLVSLKTT